MPSRRKSGLCPINMENNCLVRRLRLEVIDLGGVDRGAQLQLVVNLGRDAVVLVEVDGGSRRRVRRGLDLGQDVILRIQLKSLVEDLDSSLTRGLRGATEAGAGRRGIRKDRGEDHTRLKLMEQVHANNTSNRSSTNDGRL